MPVITIDDRQVEVEDGATVLDAARRLGIDIPTLCYRQGCRPETSCLVCVVRINGAERLRPACATKATDGMVVQSETPEIIAARRMALELLLSDHLGDCVGPCQSICPAHMDIPTMIRQIAAGRMDDAVATVKEHIPLPSVLGRICPAPCEKGCRRAQVDGAVAIRLLKRYVGDHDITSPDPHLPDCAPDTGTRIAIVGAGPAGLSAAYYLRQGGHACTVLDDHEELGGMLRYGVSEESLPREVLDAEIQRILALGIDVRCGVRLGEDITLGDLRTEFKAVLIACGEMTAEAAHAMGFEFAGRGIRADRQNHTTDRPDVFVAGSAVAPSRQAVRAVGSGRSAAHSISQYLAGEAVEGAGRPYTVRMGRLDEAELAAFSEDVPAYGRIEPEGGGFVGFSEEEARAEAERCLHCDCTGLEKCRLRDWSLRYGADVSRYEAQRRTFARETTHPHLTYEPGKCIACGLCVQIAERERDALGLSFVGRGFDVRVGVPFNESVADALETLARDCADACPTGAIVWNGSPGPCATQQDYEPSR